MHFVSEKRRSNFHHGHESDPSVPRHAVNLANLPVHNHCRSAFLHIHESPKNGKRQVLPGAQRNPKEVVRSAERLLAPERFTATRANDWACSKGRKVRPAQRSESPVL